MKEKVHGVETQSYPSRQKHPCGIGLKERLHRYTHISIDILLLQADYDTGDHREELLADVELGWNFV